MLKDVLERRHEPCALRTGTDADAQVLIDAWLAEVPHQHRPLAQRRCQRGRIVRWVPHEDEVGLRRRHLETEVFQLQDQPITGSVDCGRARQPIADPPGLPAQAVGRKAWERRLPLGRQLDPEALHVEDGALFRLVVAAHDSFRFTGSLSPPIGRDQRNAQYPTAATSTSRKTSRFLRQPRAISSLLRSLSSFRRSIVSGELVSRNLVPSILSLGKVSC